MNAIYRSVWNAALDAWVAVAEITAARGKSSRSGRDAPAIRADAASRTNDDLWARVSPLVAASLLAFAAPQFANAASLTWDANGAAAGGGNHGTWDTTTATWLTGASTYARWSNAFDDAVFPITTPTIPGGTLVAVAGAVNVQKLTFNANYSLTGGTLNLGGASPGFHTGGGSATVNSIIGGNAGLTKTGGGVLFLNGANTYTGVTRLQQGLMNLGNAAALGAAGPAASNFLVSPGTTVFFDAGAAPIANNMTILAVVPGADTVRIGGAGEWAGAPTLQGDATLEIANPGKFSGSWSDTGANVLSVVTSAGGQGATLLGNKTYSGNTTVSGNGLLVFGSANAQSPNSRLVLNGTDVNNAGDANNDTPGFGLTSNHASFTSEVGPGRNQVQWTGNGGFYSIGTGTRTVNLGGRGVALTWGAPNFVPTGNHLVLGSLAAPGVGNSFGTLDFQNGLVLPTAGTNYTIDGIGGTVAAHARISGSISGAGNLRIAGSRTGVTQGVLELSGSNSFSGELILGASGPGGNVILGSANAVTASNGINFAGPANASGDTLGLTPASGDFSRDLGAGSGAVRWTGNGGFSAAGGAREVNIGNAATPRTLTWGSGGFVPDGSWLNLAATGAGDSEIDFRNPIDLDGQVRTVSTTGTGANVARMSGVLSNGGMTYRGGGTVTASAANTYTGVTTVQGSASLSPQPTTLKVETLGNGGVASGIGAGGVAAANLVLDAGTLEYVGTGQTSNRSFTMLRSSTVRNTGSGAISLDDAVGGTAAMTLTLDGTNPVDQSNQLTGMISGSGVSLIKTGTNNWRLANATNSYAGATAVNLGVLEVTKLANGGAASSIGTSSNLAGNLMLGAPGWGSGTLRYLGTGDSSDRQFTVNLNSAIESSGTGALVLTSTQPIAAMALTPILTLGGSNTDDNALAANWADSPLADSAARRFYKSGIEKKDGGAWTLRGVNNGYTGNTEIEGGVLWAGTSTAITGGMGKDSNAGTHPNPNVRSTTAMSSLIDLNGGVLGLTAASGDFGRPLTTVLTALSNTTDADPSNDLFTHGIKWSGSGGFAADGVDRRVNLNNDGLGVSWDTNGFVPTNSALILGATSADRTVDFINPIALGAADRTVQADNGSAAVDGVLSGQITGTGGFVKTGAGTLALKAANLYQGTTNVQAGTLQVGTGGTTGTLGVAPKVTVAGGATLAFNRSDAFVDAHNITGAGTLAQIGTGSTTLTNAVSAVGATEVLGGTLNVDRKLTSNTLRMGAGVLNVNGTFEKSGGAAAVVTGDPLTASTLRVNSGGTLRVNGDLGDADDVINVAAGGTLDVAKAPLVMGDGNDAVTLGGTLVGDEDLDLGAGNDTFSVGDGANIGGYKGTIDGGAQTAADILVLNSSQALTLDPGQVTNFETLTKNNTGTATLVGTHGFITTNLNGGKLAVNGTLNTETIAMADDTALEVKGAVQKGPSAQTRITGSTGGNTINVAAGGILTANIDMGGGDDVLAVHGTLNGDALLGAGQDTFYVSNTTVVNGNVDAGLGNDTLDVTVTGSAVTVPLGGLEFESLGKSGDGTLEIRGPSRFMDVKVHGGTLAVTSSGSVDPMAGFALNTTIDAGATLRVDGNFNGGDKADSLTVSGTVAGARGIGMGAADDVLTLSDGAVISTLVDGEGHVNGDTVVLANVNTMAFTGANIVNFEKLEKNNGGEARVIGSQTFSGGTAIHGGKLTVNGTLTTPTVSLAGGTTLEVSGIVKGAGTSSTVITGSDGADTVKVNAGSTLFATGDLGKGNDVFHLAGKLTGTMALGDGDDTFVVLPTSEVDGDVNGGRGNDKLDVNVPNAASTVPMGGLKDFESLGKSGAGTLQINGSAGFITVDVTGGTLEITPSGKVDVHETTVAQGATIIVDGEYNGKDTDDTFRVAGEFKGRGSVNLGLGNDKLIIQDHADLSQMAKPIDGGDGDNTLETDIAGSATLGGVTRFHKLAKTNIGTLHVNGPAPSDFSTVSVEGGTLVVGPAGSIGGVSTAMVATGAKLQLDGSITGTTNADSVTMAGELVGVGKMDLLDGDDRFMVDGKGVIAKTVRLDGGTGTDAFVLGGADAGSFDVSRLDNGIDNFEALRKEGTGTWTLTGTGADTQNWTVEAGKLVANTDSLKGNVQNQGELVFDQVIDGAYRATLSGTGDFTKAGAGMLDLTGMNNAMGSTKVEQGRLQVTGALTSPVAVNLGAELGGTGLIRGEVVNSGVVSPGTRSDIGTLTVQGNYVGNGGQLNIRSVLGGNASPTDRLVVDGGQVSGRTQVNVANQGGAGALTTGDGIQVVGLINGATSSADAFNLGAPVVIGPFQYDLSQGGAGSWYLRSRDNSPKPQPVLESGTPVVVREVAASSPEVSLNNSLAAMAQVYGVQSLGTWQNRQGNADEGMKRDGTHYWARAFGAQGQMQGGGLQSRGADFSYNAAGVQGGADVAISSNGATQDRAGVYVSAGGLRGDVRHFDDSEAGRNSMRATSVGGYWTRTSTDGWYLDGVAQATRYDNVRTKSIQGIDGETQGWGVAASVEAGKSVPITETVSIEPQVQLIVQHNKLDDVRDSYNNDIGLGGSTSALGRVGGRLVKKWAGEGEGAPSVSTWVRANVWNELAGKSSATYQTANGPLAYGYNPRGSWAEVELGFSGSLTPSMSMHGSVAYQRSLGGIKREGSSFSTGVNGGGAAAVSVGLSHQLSRNAKLTTNVSYANGPKGSSSDGAKAHVGLDLQW